MLVPAYGTQVLPLVATYIADLPLLLKAFGQST